MNNNNICNLSEINRILFKSLDAVYNGITKHMATHIYKFDDYKELSAFTKRVIKLVEQPNTKEFWNILVAGYMSVKFTEISVNLRKLVNILDKTKLTTEDIAYLNERSKYINELNLAEFTV